MVLFEGVFAAAKTEGGRQGRHGPAPCLLSFFPPSFPTAVRIALLNTTHETQCARMRAAATSPTNPPGMCKDKPVHKVNNHHPCRSPRSRLPQTLFASEGQTHCLVRQLEGNAQIHKCTCICLYFDLGREPTGFGKIKGTMLLYQLAHICQHGLPKDKNTMFSS